VRKNLKAHFNPTARNFQHIEHRKWLNKYTTTAGIQSRLQVPTTPQATLLSF